MLGIKKEDVSEYMTGGLHYYVRLLGCRKDSEKLLARIAKKSTLPLLIRLAESGSLPRTGKKMLRKRYPCIQSVHIRSDRQIQDSISERI